MVSCGVIVVPRRAPMTRAVHFPVRAPGNSRRLARESTRRRRAGGWQRQKIDTDKEWRERISAPVLQTDCDREVPAPTGHFRAAARTDSAAIVLHRTGRALQTTFANRHGVDAARPRVAADADRRPCI